MGSSAPCYFQTNSSRFRPLQVYLKLLSCGCHKAPSPELPRKHRSMLERLTNAKTSSIGTYSTHCVHDANDCMSSDRRPCHANNDNECNVHEMSTPHKHAVTANNEDLNRSGQYSMFVMYSTRYSILQRKVQLSYGYSTEREEKINSREIYLSCIWPAAHLLMLRDMIRRIRGEHPSMT